MQGYYGSGVNGIGEITPVRVAISTVLIGGAVVAFAAGGVIQAWADGYFLGRAKKKGVTYTTLAKRNAALGGALGAVAALGILTA
ncbi:MAG: hypothetical protein VX199_07895 [Chloroflexota bacterium]|nr:hypothetical protein [Chloroflexota bacterium]